MKSAKCIYLLPFFVDPLLFPMLSHDIPYSFFRRETPSDLVRGNLNRTFWMSGVEIVGTAIRFDYRQQARC